MPTRSLGLPSLADVRKAQVRKAPTDEPSGGKRKEKGRKRASPVPGRATGSKRARTAATRQELSCFSEQEKAEVQSSLLKWYGEVYRDLPWRKTPASVSNELGENDLSGVPASKFAYYVWVSEIMLQQTQVATVVDYFKKWIGLWPDVYSLAQASLDQVHEAWAGLGYYRRAGYLLSGAKYIVEKCKGEFPETEEELKKIPGVGPYTSAAIASIAFNKPCAAVDGNVIRVISRLRALGGDPKNLKKVHQQLASEILEQSHPGDFNQAMMELGATVCRPTTPNCHGCPLKSVCEAHKREKGFLAEGGNPDLPDAPKATDYPTAVAKREKKRQTVSICVLKVVPRNTKASECYSSSKGAYLLVKRPASGLLAGLWEFPTLSDASDLNRRERKDAMMEMLADKFGISAQGEQGYQILDRRDVGEEDHIFTHIQMKMIIEKVIVAGEMQENHTANGLETKWVPARDMSKQGFCTMVKKAWMLCCQSQSQMSLDRYCEGADKEHEPK